MATSFRPAGSLLASGAALLGSLALGGSAAAQTVTRDEALRLAFPGAQVLRRTAYLDPAQVAEAARLAGRDAAVSQRVVTYYVAVRDGPAPGVAYFDSHRVRTLAEVIMVVVDQRSRVERIEVLKFAEPPEYRAPERWLQRLEGQSLGPGLSLKRDVVNITGATLTAHAVTQAVRRVLALHAVIRPFEVAR